MKTRTGNPKSTNYEYYGARGVRLCEDWHDFLKFCKWAFDNGFNEENKKLQIHRIDEKGDYCPENCEWVNRTENLKRMWENVKK